MNDTLTYECGCWYIFDFTFEDKFLTLDEYGTQFGLCEKHGKQIREQMGINERIYDS